MSRKSSLWVFRAVDSDRREARVTIDLYLDDWAHADFIITDPDGNVTVERRHAPVTIERAVYTKRILLAVVSAGADVTGSHRTVIGAAEDWAGKWASIFGQRALRAHDHRSDPVTGETTKYGQLIHECTKTGERFVISVDPEGERHFLWVGPDLALVEESAPTSEPRRSPVFGSRINEWR